MFEAVHGGEFIEGGLHHPNQYYEQSRKVLNPKTFEDSDGKEEQAEPTSPQQKEIAIDVGVVGVLILAPTFLRVDVPAGKVARREVKRVSSSNCVHMRFTFTLYYFMLPLLLPLLLLQRTRKCAV